MPPQPCPQRTDPRHRLCPRAGAAPEQPPQPASQLASPSHRRRSGASAAASTPYAAGSGGGEAAIVALAARQAERDEALAGSRRRVAALEAELLEAEKELALRQEMEVGGGG